MSSLTEIDLRAWVAAITHPLAAPATLMPWLEGPLRNFFPYTAVVLGHGELIADQLKVTHMLATGHHDAYLHQIAQTFELAQRGSLRWWFSNRQPFYIDPAHPPSHTGRFELEEIQTFGLGNIAGHGVLNLKANAGTYFGFSGVAGPLRTWHLDALRLIAPVLNDLLLAHLAALPQSTVPTLQALTSRQKDIVRQLANGMDDKTIARTLGLSEKTIRNQLAEVYARIGIHKRTQLLALLR